MRAVLVVYLVELLIWPGGCEQIYSRLVSRAEWGARPPKARQDMQTPVKSVILHHTYIPKACSSRDQCERAMRAMQNFHMDDRGWDDIGYTFVVGGSVVFEGRGWHTVGAHAPPFNNRSVGIAYIGDYTDSVPSDMMLNLSQTLIAFGVNQSYIHPDYQLFGHRQVRPTECPGNALYQLLQSWPHWTESPTTAATFDLSQYPTVEGRDELSQPT